MLARDNIRHPSKPGFQLDGQHNDRRLSEGTFAMLVKKTAWSGTSWTDTKNVIKCGFNTPIYHDIPWTITRAEALDLLCSELERIQKTANSTLHMRVSQGVWDSIVIFAQGRRPSDWIVDPVYQSLMYQGSEAYRGMLAAASFTLIQAGDDLAERFVWASGLAKG